MYKGQARLFLAKIAKQNADVDAAARAAYAPLKERAERNPTPRYESLVESIRTWEDRMPPFGRLHIDVDLQRKSLDLREVRLVACEYSKDAWGDCDHVGALLISELHLYASRAATGLHSTARVMVSHHCLGRFLERSGDTSEPCLLLDLLHLGKAHEAIGASARSHAEKKWEWVAPSGLRYCGTWCYRIVPNGKREYFIGADTVKIDQLVRVGSVVAQQ